ncbi:hypothetical protein JCM12296A_57320 [Desulfosarcina cetonica]|uniref:glycosyltransferase n=1 Tax=Desulfosarcina cetonica TaxID=90730 RepID=UPI0006D07F8D|nr:glycosyltransferase [Desulfosarcina cetonica]
MFNQPMSLKKKIFYLLSDFTIRKADLTIVTNLSILEKYIVPSGGIGIILPDKIPHLNGKKCRCIDKNKNNVLFITSFGRDEPIEEFLKAIKDIDKNFFFYISGNYKKYSKYITREGLNYKFTGFLKDEDFISLLSSIDAVMVLTKHENTLTCGAYEALSFGKPMILSETNTIKSYFNKGAVYTNNSPRSIRSCVNELFKDFENLSKQAIILRKEIDKEWNSKFISFRKCIVELSK